MTTCTIGEECVTHVMRLVERDPQPFILMPERIIEGGKLTQTVAELPQSQDVPLEYFIGREELLSFMFSNQFPPIVHDPTIIPLPATVWMLAAAIGLLTMAYKR